MKSRTTLQFEQTADPWPVIEQWADANGYKPKPPEGDVRVWQKGLGFLVAPMMLKARFDSGTLYLEAWIKMNLFVRLMSLFILPAEMGIESGGIRAMAPRSIARKAVNKLLTELGQPPII